MSLRKLNKRECSNGRQIFIPNASKFAERIATTAFKHEYIGIFDKQDYRKRATDAFASLELLDSGKHHSSNEKATSPLHLQDHHVRCTRNQIHNKLRRNINRTQPDDGVSFNDACNYVFAGFVLNVKPTSFVGGRDSVSSIVTVRERRYATSQPTGGCS
jgi:hypothetical protein